MSVPDVLLTLARAEAFLLARQTKDGLWPDFALEPGASEAWTTAVVACALAEPPVAKASLVHLRRAADTLHRLRRPEGWGYNTRTAVDADSTAWVLRFLGKAHDLRQIDSSAILEVFLDPEGTVHTFRGEPFGSWTGVHDDVAPAVGLALISAAASGSGVARIRSASLKALREYPPWRSFWWTVDAYAIAQNLAFLSVSGGVPDEAVSKVRRWLVGTSARSAFEAAQLLACAHAVASAEAPARVAELLARQLADGSWPPAPVLLVPAQHTLNAPLAFPDLRGFLSAAMAVLALKQHISAVREH